MMGLIFASRNLILSKLKLRLAVICASVVIIFSQHPAKAHPHIWIDNQIRLLGNGGKIKALAVHWRFDQVYSTQIRSEFDVNRNNKFDPDEVKNIQATGFAALAERNYFAHIYLDNKLMTGFKLSKFNAIIENNSVIYDFTLDLIFMVDPKSSKTTIGFYDDEYYVDIAYTDKNSVKPEFGGSSLCKYNIITDVKHPIYGGMFNPKALEINCEK
ncbi:MAG: DUF1007 family protein [Alphaproteobacteria bacterium]|nr:DUF1007 family protein [Alphaproteobacteria bacterium]